MEYERLKIALEFLKDGKSFGVGDIHLGMNDKIHMYVTGWSQMYYIENLSKQQSLKELDEIKSIFQEMVNSSQELKSFIKDKIIKYNLAFNYGMGSIGICSEEDGVVKWEIELK